MPKGSHALQLGSRRATGVLDEGLYIYLLPGELLAEILKEQGSTPVIQGGKTTDVDGANRDNMGLARKVPDSLRAGANLPVDKGCTNFDCRGERP